MAFFGGIGRALGGAMKAPARAMLPQKRPMQGGGIGPSPQGGLGGKIAAMQQKQMQPPPMQNQSALQNMARAGAGIGAAFGMNRMRPQPPPMQQPSPVPEPSAAPASPMYDDQNNQAMMDIKRQQMEAMRPQVGMGGMARPHVMPRFGMGGGYQPPAEQMQQMSMPDESVDQMRRNKFMQMRQGGIGPRMGMGFGRPQPMQMEQQEPEIQY